MEPIIAPISTELLKAELTPAKKLRDTNKSNNEIYIVNHHDSPNVMKEIGRLREDAFRDSGGGSGLSMDIDDFDTMENPYQQLIVWDPEAEKILGGYRYILGSDIKLDENGQPMLATSHMFHFSEKFIKEYLPYTIELGRSFVAPEYQSRQAGAKALFALDNLWDGIGGLVATDPSVKYLSGKVTIYSSSPELSRKAMVYYLDKCFGDREGLITSKNPELWTEEQGKMFEEMFTGADYKENYQILNNYVKSFGDVIPPLIHSYIGLSSTMKTFGTTFDPDFGDCYDTAMIITIDDIYQDKKDRYINSFFNN